MVKKKVNKTKLNSKIKSIPKVAKVKSEPIHFKNFNLNKKIISVILIVLAIGVIGSVFPGEGTTGAFTLFGEDITASRVSVWLNAIFPTTISTDNLIIYEKFVLFLLLFSLLAFVGSKFLNLEGLTNAMVAGAISLISTWFIPKQVLLMIGTTYSSLYASLLLIIPVLTIGVVIWAIPRTKIGYWAKTILSFILLMVYGSTGTSVYTSYLKTGGAWFVTFTSLLVITLIIVTGYTLIKALFTSDKELRKTYRIDQTREARDNMKDYVKNMVAATFNEATGEAANKPGEE